jgi:hypothetical protein
MMLLRVVVASWWKVKRERLQPETDDETDEGLL